MKIRLFAGLEAINYQSNKLFLEITEQIRLMRDYKPEVKDEDWFENPWIDKLCVTLKYRFGFGVEMIHYDEPAVVAPRVSDYHSLKTVGSYNSDLILQASGGASTAEDVTKLLKKLNTPAIKGTVDMNTARVTGDFCDMTFLIAMPKNMFVYDNVYTAEEVAAILLHEVGHIFTFLEYVDRTITTNHVLSQITKTLDDTLSFEEKAIVLGKASDLMNLDPQKKKALFESKTEMQLSVVCIDASVEKCISELGKSIYDTNAAEFLADQFATRLGAGRHLVTGLDKLPTGYEVFSNLSMASYVGLAVCGVGLSPLIPFFLLLLVVSADKVDDEHGNIASRIDRIKRDNIHKLKDRSLPAKVRNAILDENTAMDAIAAKYKDNLNVIETIAYYTRPGYRAAHKYELLQKQIEKLASNDLFAKAAQLKTI